MNRYFIESFKITKLWGYHDIDLTFNNDVNILIGPNASGKTTILNLLHSILSANLRSVSDVNFDQAEIKLRSFKGRSERTIKVDTANGIFSVGQKKFEIDMIAIANRKLPESQDPSEKSFEKGSYIRGTAFRSFIIHTFREKMVIEELYDELTALVPIVWLPVSRRLPVTEDEEESYTGTGPLESVDLRLDELLDDLSDYHSRLNAMLSESYRKFEHQALSVILYSEEDDQLDSIPPSFPTQAEKEQLQRAFEAAGLLDEQMRIRIDEHFAEVGKVLETIREIKDIDSDSGLGDLLELLLIHRTHSMVGYARELEEDRERIFKPLRDYEETVNSFLDGKSVKVDRRGKLKIESSSLSVLNPHHLSSGEKQILILLTQALLRVDEPVVYIADEPELSLHVTWQEKLLESLVKLGGQIQVIVATHSPDIAGKFTDNVIDLGRKN